ncbi:DUF305 domain-containing protein [Actinomadura sp. ATCC 31491]|uniref:DUF305 domain-containing protein n=1 Tax=Actinomadura luzonensis TaxID=2805427 RepID=A0ABT0FUT3_9ACTN|nr:DUF305 domain-containing protein [Actinomadura luzonensis]MCK2216100.1 DUF305 domain-containing protein [Actinomadura luzonensis]
MRLRMAAVLLTILLVPVAGCAAAGAEPGYSEADVRFNQQMITHHRETIHLAELAAKRGSGAYVRELGARLIPEEQADITAMSGWLKSWDQAVPPEEASTAATGLKAGPGFDQGWLTMVSEHLQHGIHMAEELRAGGKHAPTRELAERIVKAQTAEIAEIAGHLS